MAIKSYQKAIARDEVQEMIRARRKARMDFESGMAAAHARGRAEERVNTEAERKRAELEAKRAELEAMRAERLAQKLRGLGVEPD